MSENVKQIFDANPTTAMTDTDLVYLGNSPYSVTDDSAATWATMKANIPSAIVTEETGTSGSMLENQSYITNNAALVTMALPTTAAVGTYVEIVGKGAGGWKISQGAGQSINVGNTTSTVGAGGSVASTNQNDTLKLMCVTANTVFTAVGGVSAAYTIV